MAAISGDWLEALRPEFSKPYYRDLFAFVQEEYRTRTIYPPAPDLFNALHETPLGKVRAVILGQDPYHGEGQAHGMCFSVRPGCPAPPSLVNIYRELHDDLGCFIPDNGYLLKWARQGVLLLNTVLTVRAHEANSHRGRGWEEFTDAILRAVNEQDRPVVYMLWGSPAQAKAPMLTNSRLSDAAISASATPFWKRTDSHRLTGRLRTCRSTKESCRLTKESCRFAKE